MWYFDFTVSADADASCKCALREICKDLEKLQSVLTQLDFSSFLCLNIFLPVDECVDKLCDNGGTCVDRINSYSCTCVQGYTGDHCETDVDDCDGVECQNGGSCVDGVNSYTCTCDLGFKGEHCEKIDACALSSCQNGATWHRRG